MFKIIIPMETKQKILSQLDSFGVNPKMIFPGLDGLGKYIENYYNCTGKIFCGKIPVADKKSS